MVDQSSRYRRKDGYTSEDPVRSNNPIEGLAPHESATAEIRREHQVVGSDRLDLIASRYYGDPLKFWLICDAHDVIFPEEILVPGQTIKIPVNRL